MITSLFPLLEDGLHLRTLSQQGLGQQVAVVRGRLVDSAMLIGLAECGQRLHHEPCRIVGILNGQFLLRGSLWEERRQVDGLHSCFVLGIRNCLGDVFAVGQYRQIMLLTIRESVARGHHFANEE